MRHSWSTKFVVLFLNQLVRWTNRKQPKIWKAIYDAAHIQNILYPVWAVAESNQNKTIPGTIFIFCPNSSLLFWKSIDYLRTLLLSPSYTAMDATSSRSVPQRPWLSSSRGTTNLTVVVSLLPALHSTFWRHHMYEFQNASTNSTFLRKVTSVTEMKNAVEAYWWERGSEGRLFFFKGRYELREVMGL